MGTQAVGPQNISVIVCAYTERRWAHIGALVESLRAQTLVPTEVILVVDHNRSLEDRARGAFSDLVVIANRFEQGLSGARNTGVGIAVGEIVAFIDDDAAAERDWLERLVNAYEDDDVVGVGGYVEPNWEAASPRWFPPEFYWVVGCSYIGLPTERRVVRNPIGANMSFRRSALLRGGPFRHGVGRAGDGLLPMGCEETELSIRILTAIAGSRILFEPAARVRHFVPNERASFRYIMRRCYAEGISKAIVASAVGQSAALRAERTYVSRTLGAALARNVKALVRGDQAAVVRFALIVVGTAAATAGYLRGHINTPRLEDTSPHLWLAPTHE
jgi:glycosyltransferase involved in cell wall biosynthesis